MRDRMMAVLHPHQLWDNFRLKSLFWSIQDVTFPKTNCEILSMMFYFFPKWTTLILVDFIIFEYNLSVVFFEIWSMIGRKNSKTNKWRANANLINFNCHLAFQIIHFAITALVEQNNHFCSIELNPIRRQFQWLLSSFTFGFIFYSNASKSRTTTNQRVPLGRMRNKENN